MVSGLIRGVCAAGLALAIGLGAPGLAMGAEALSALSVTYASADPSPVTFYAYDVGSLTNAAVVFHDPYSEVVASLSTASDEDLASIAATLSDFVSQRGLAPDAEAVVDSEGLATFTGLGSDVYLIIGNSSEDVPKPQPFLSQGEGVAYPKPVQSGELLPKPTEPPPFVESLEDPLDVAAAEGLYAKTGEGWLVATLLASAAITGVISTIVGMVIRDEKVYRAECRRQVYLLRKTGSSYELHRHSH